jgi:GTP-binding protein
VNKEIKKEWSAHLSHYLTSRQELKLLILILDARRDLSLEDKQMIDWANKHHKELLFVFTKSDKLSSSEKKNAEKKLPLSLAEHSLQTSPSYLFYSIKEKECRVLLRQFIASALNKSPLKP